MLQSGAIVFTLGQVLQSREIITKWISANVFNNLPVSESIFIIACWILLSFSSPETCENGELDHIHVCGKGATGCYGSLWNLTCECDKTEGYVQSSDGMKCVACKLSYISTNVSDIDFKDFTANWLQDTTMYLIDRYLHMYGVSE